MPSTPDAVQSCLFMQHTGSAIRDWRLCLTSTAMATGASVSASLLMGLTMTSHMDMTVGGAYGDTSCAAPNNQHDTHSSVKGNQLHGTDSIPLNLQPNTAQAWRQQARHVTCSSAGGTNAQNSPSEELAGTKHPASQQNL